MADIEQMKKALVKAHNNGDTEAANLIAEKIKQAQLAEPERSVGENIVGGLEAAATVGSGIIAEPIAGLAGIAQSLNPFADEGAGADTVESVRSSLTYQPKTEEGQGVLKDVGESLAPIGDVFKSIEEGLGDYVYEKTGSPAFAAAATAAPTAFLELIGAGVGKKAVKSSEAATKAARESVALAKDGETLTKAARRGADAAELAKEGVETVMKGKPQDIVDLANVDPKYFQALDELGVSAEPLAAFASKNSQFRDIQGALRSVPGSALDVQARNFIEDVARSADDLIQRYGGTLDKAELSQRFKADSINTIDDLANEADKLYSSLRDTLPPSTKIDAGNTLNFLKTKAAEFGGVDELPSDLKKVYNSLNKEGGPTLGLVDQIRKEFGQATRKGSGRFKDTESGLAKAMYARLSNDVDSFAESQGLEAVTNSAKRLVAQRKQLEDNLIGLYGKNLDKALGDTVGQSLKGLSKGRVEEFKKVMDSIPKEKRGEVVISYLNDVFKGTGANQQSLNATQFTKWFEEVQRSPTVRKELYKNMPTGSRKALVALYNTSKGISRAQAQTVRTGAINAMFNPETGFIRKMVGNAASTTANIASGAFGGPAGSLASQVAQDATRQFLSQSTDGARAAANLMSTPKFQQLIRDAVEEGTLGANKRFEKIKRAEKALEKTKRYQDWVKTLTDDQRAALGGGITAYLLGSENQSSDIEPDTP